MEMDFTQLLIGVIGGGGVTTIATTIINKARNKGQKMTDNDTHLQTLSEIMTETIKNVQEINKETISNLKSELAQAQELTKLSHAREDQLIELVNKGREYQEVLEAKNKHKNKIIQKARKCDLLQGKPLEDCVVLNAYDEYTECKVNCKLNKGDNNGENVHS
jgi:regulator of sigma D